MRNLRLATLLLLGAFATSAHAGGFEGEIGYLHLDTDLSGVSLGGVYGIVGYTWESMGYDGTIEFMGTYGLNDDSTDLLGQSVDVELDSMLGVGYRGTMEINPDLSWYYRAVYARIDVSAKWFGISVSDAESDFGLGAGLTYRRFTIGFLKFTGDLDGANAIVLGYRF